MAAAMMIASGKSALKELKAGAPAGRIRELSGQVEAALRVEEMLKRVRLER